MARTARHTTPPTTRKVLMVAYPGVHSLDVVGPLEILATAKFFRPGPPEPYEIAIAASEAGPVEASSGLTITASTSFDSVLNGTGEIDTLMIAGGHGTSSAMKDPDLIAFVRRVAPRVRRVAAICTGSLILAEAGLLDGRRASTHWFWCPTLRDDYLRKHPETGHGKASPKKECNLHSFDRDQAEKTGVDSSTVRRSADRGKKVTPAALAIRARAEMRLAEEYDAAQERGEVHRHGGQTRRDVDVSNIPSASDLGLRRDEIHEARRMRDAESADPGLIERTVNGMVDRGEEPTRAA